MQLLRLLMRNFKRYRHQDVMFRDGITGILGNNGTGKSTIVDAILFCLYGVKETGLDYLISATAGERERAEVRLDFSVRGEEFQMVRSLDRRKRHDVRIHRGGRLMAKGVSEVQEAVGRILRMGSADFKHTIFSGQRELLDLVGAPPEERRRWFRRVLGIDSLNDKGKAILKEETAAARDEVLLIEGRLGEVDPESVGAGLEALGKTLAATEETLRSLEGELEAIEDRRRSLEDEMRRLRALEREVIRLTAMMQNRVGESNRIEEELAGISREVRTLEGQREEFRRLAASEPAFEGLRDRFEAGRAKSLRCQALRALEAGRRTLAGEVREGLARLKEEEEALGRDEERLRALGPAVARRAEVRERLTEIGALEEKYRDLVAAIGRKEEALSRAGGRGAELRARIGTIQEARVKFTALLDPYRALPRFAADPVAALEARHRALLQEIAAESAARDQASGTRARLGADLANLVALGTGGDCPLCHQPLGARYHEVVEGLEREMGSQEEIITGAGEALAGAEQERAALEATLSEARRLREVCGRMAEVTAEWEAVQEQSRRDLAEKDLLEGELAVLSHDPEERQRLDGELAALEGSWREHVAISDRVKRRGEIARRLFETGERLRRLEEELAGIRREREELGFDPAAHDRLEAEIRTAEEEHRRFLAMKPGMERLPLLEERAAGLGERAGAVRAELARVEEDLKAIHFSPQSIARNEQERHSIQQQAMETTQRAGKCRSDLTHLREDRERLAGILEKFERDRKEHDRLSEEIRLLELTREHLAGFTNHLLGVVRDQIQGETGRILSEITDGRYDTVILDDDFRLLVHDLGGDYPVGRFSGGEQDDVAIALRIALSRYIAEMHELHDSTFLIFDEIFGSQDEERRGNILRALRAMEPYFPQIFLISHVSEIQGEFGNTLVVEAVSGSESRIIDLEEAGA